MQSTVSIKPSIISTAALLLLAAVFFVLGKWQFDRSIEKQQRISLFSNAQQQSGLPEPGAARECTRVILHGTFDLQRHILADNQVLNGLPGVHVYTPFRAGNSLAILVNRGWLPLAQDRRHLPSVTTPGALVKITGRIGPIPRAGRRLGAIDDVSQDHWPQLLTYPDLGKIATALQTELYPLVLFLDQSSPGGFDGRNWKPVYMTPAKHRAYAFQWFALALTAIITWIVLALRRGKYL